LSEVLRRARHDRMTIGPHALEQRGHRRENVRCGPLGTSAVDMRRSFQRWLGVAPSALRS